MNHENVIEWQTGDKEMTVSLTQRKWITKVKRLAEKSPTDVHIEAVNEDGSIMANISLRALHLTLYGSKNGGFCKDSEEEMEDGEE